MTEPVVVVGATGRQGGAVARRLRAAGVPVRVLVRDPERPAVRSLVREGFEPVEGDLDDAASLVAALRGARGVFSVQMPDLNDLMGDGEVRQSRNLASAAAEAGLAQIVHTSVSGAGRGPVAAEAWGEHMAHYWSSKAAAEAAVRESGVRHWTILRPATSMQNFVRPSFYFDEGTSDRLLVANDLDQVGPFVALDDIGAAATAAFADPERSHGLELELAGDLLSFREAASILADVSGTPIVLPESPAAAVAAGLAPHFARSQRYMSAHPAPARPEFARALGLPTTSFAAWAEQFRGRSF